MPTTRKPAAKKTTIRSAAAKKTSTRRAPAQKSPTTQSPMDQEHKRVKSPVEVQAPSVHVNPLTEEQRQAKLEAYHVLKSAGLAIPVDLANEVEDWITVLNAQRDAETAQRATELASREAQIAEANKNGPWYIRNGYPAPFNLRLDRQTESRRIELKPRGMPGDLHPLKDEDLKDPILTTNLNLGLIEIIPAGEATLIIEKQTTNMGQRVHTPLAVLRSENDKPYAQGQVKVETEYNSQGITVASVDQRIMTGELHNREIGGPRGTGGVTRVQPGQGVPDQGQLGPQPATSVVRSGFVPTGGNPAIVQYGPLGDNAQARVADDLARRKSVQGIEGGIPGDVKVTVGPVQRT